MAVSLALIINHLRYSFVSSNVSDMENELLSTKDAAGRLGISSMRIRALISAGRLPSQLIGRDHIIQKSDLVLVAERKAGRPKKVVESIAQVVTKKKAVKK
jgi:excisionase family DNA binding protein